MVHFGVFGDVQRHVAELRSRLHLWRDLVGRGASEREFTDYARADVIDDTYDRAMPFWQSYAGLKRYVERVMPNRSPATGAA